MANTQQVQVATSPVTGSIILASRRTRPFWFDGRFLAARDLERDQNYFLQGQSNLGIAAGFGVIHGLKVDTVSSGGSTDNETLIIRAGQGLTPGGDVVMISQDLTVRLSDLADEENREVQFGLSGDPTAVARTRTGLYVIALRPVQFTAHPITAYPTSIQGSRTTHDGDIVEATAVSLVPFAAQANNVDATIRQAAMARQIFATDSSGALSNSLLPLAMVSIQRGTIEWVDMWMVRRDSGPESSGVRLGLADPATQQAFLQQYDAQLQNTVNAVVQSGATARFAATDHFQILPPAGRFPLASIDTVKFTQLFFPQQTNVLLSLIPGDELPALIEDGMSLPPIDLTLPASSYADLELLALVPVARRDYAALAANLPDVQLVSALPQVLNSRKPVNLLQFFSGAAPLLADPPGGATWQQAIGTQTYGYYVRRRSSPLLSTAVMLSVFLINGNQGVSLTATVSPAAASGTVTFKDSSNILGTVVLNAGVATLPINTISHQSHSFTAAYAGDSSFASSASATVTVTVGG
jgi:hypothetical protein